MNIPEIKNSEVVAFKPSGGQTEFQVILDGENDTVWATEQQIMDLFGKARRTIGEHIKNVYEEGELSKESTWREIRQVRKEGNRDVSRQVPLYNLDVIISVGYRVKSKIGVEFRKWATARLKEYLIRGYSINESRLQELRQSIKLIKAATDLSGETQDQQKGIVRILSDYALGLDILDGYDTQSLEIKDVSPNSTYKIRYEDAIEAVHQLRVKFGGSNLFGNEKDKSFRSSIATIDQTFDGKELYQSIEEKAATLLYLVVKNHSFTDGNKRIAAWLFVWYLDKNNCLYNEDGNPRLENNALASLTLMIALSNPEEKELMVKVVINSINRNN